MKIKGLSLLLVLVLIVLALLSGCAPAEEPREFPLAAGDIESALAAEGLLWKLTQPQSFREGHINYMLENENGKLTATINNYDIEERRNVSLNLMYPHPNVSKSIIEEIHEEDWEKLFSLACGLYDGGKNSGRVYEGFCKALKKEKYEPKERGAVSWHKKIGGVDYMVLYRPSVKYYGKFDLLSITVRNNADYKAYLLELEEAKARESERKRAAERRTDGTEE